MYLVISVVVSGLKSTAWVEWAAMSSPATLFLSLAAPLCLAGLPTHVAWFRDSDPP